MRPLRLLAPIAILLAAAAGCGDDDAVSDSSTGLAPADGTDGAADEQPGSGPDAGEPLDDSGVTVTVDGQTYAVTTVQTCELETDADREVDVAVYGFASTGPRVELSFRYQGADTSITGTDQFFGSLGIAGEVDAAIVTDEPFDFLAGDRSTVSGSIQMEDRSTDPARTVDVAFDLTCP